MASGEQEQQQQQQQRQLAGTDAARRRLAVRSTRILSRRHRGCHHRAVDENRCCRRQQGCWAGTGEARLTLKPVSPAAGRAGHQLAGRLWRDSTNNLTVCTPDAELMHRRASARRKACSAIAKNRADTGNTVQRSASPSYQVDQPCMTTSVLIILRSYA